MYDFWRKNFVKMKKVLCNCFKEIFDRLLYNGMYYNPHWNRNFEAASPQASDGTSQFVTWFNLVNILWKNHEPYWERPPGRRGEAMLYINTNKMCIILVIFYLLKPCIVSFWKRYPNLSTTSLSGNWVNF